MNSEFPKWEMVRPTSPRTMQEISDHWATYYSKPSFVFHDSSFDQIHLDIHVIKPTFLRRYWVLFTTGMSDKPMNSAAGPEYRFAELAIMLPKSWKVQNASQDESEKWAWPIHWLRRLAKYPHATGTWLWMGHSVPNGDPPEPLCADTRMCGWYLLPPLRMPKEDWTVKRSDGREVGLFVMYPIHKAEMDLLIKEGPKSLIKPFETAGVTDVIQLGRPSSLP